MQVVQVDDIGTFTTSSRGNSYAVVIQDVFTKFLYAKAVSKRDGKSIVEVLQEFFQKFGYPDVITTDGAKAMVSEAMKDFCGAFGIQHHVGSPYEHGSTGLVERANRSIESMIQKYVSEDQRDWDSLLEAHLTAYNSSVQASTQFSPFFLMFGREMRLPTDITLPTVAFEKRIRGSTEYVRGLLRSLSKVYSTAKKNLSKAFESQSKRFNAEVRAKSQFKVGDKVLRYIPMRKVGLSAKLLPQWYGPYTIARLAGPVSFELELETLSRKGYPVTKKVTVHASHLKPYRQSEVLDSPEKVAGK